MKKETLSALLSSILFLGGCATTAFGTFQPITPSLLQASSETKHVVEKNYQLGVQQSVYVGQSVIRVKDYVVRKTSSEPFFVSPVPVTATWMLGPTITFPAKTNFQIIGTVTHMGSTYFAVSPPHPTYQSIPMLVYSDGAYDNKVMARNGLVFSPGDPTGVRYEPQRFKFERPTREEIQRTGGYVNFEIVYSGATKDGMRMLYREYTPDDMARPAYSQELVYDSNPGIVRFRDLAIRILAADSQQVSYLVESDGQK